MYVAYQHAQCSGTDIRHSCGETCEHCLVWFCVFAGARRGARQGDAGCTEDWKRRGDRISHWIKIHRVI